MIFILIPWFHPAYKAGGPIQSVANMVNGLREACGANGEEFRRSEILPVAECTVNRFAQQTDVCSTQDDKTKKDDSLRSDNFQFKIFCSNKDLDGGILQGIKAADKKWRT